VLTRIKLADVVECLDRNALYRLQWGAKNAKGEEWERLKADFDAKVRDLIREAERDGWLEPKVVYGYYPCQSDGHEVIVYDPPSVLNGAQPRELTRFVFPRQPERERLCLADYFRSRESGEYDVVGLQIVTMGRKVDDLTETLQQSGDYARAYFIHGLGVSLAEALAEYTKPSHPSATGAERNTGQTLLLGVSRLPRPGRAREVVQGASGG
jgi:5-methyltetrahydrofolate--homocysteine methyltransferase